MSNLEASGSGRIEYDADMEFTLPDQEPGTDTSGTAAQVSRSKKPYMKKFKEPDSDEDVGDPRNLYNVAESWRTLMSLASCQKVMVSEKVQKILKIEVGINVTQEFPWKQVQYKDLRDVLFDELENSADLIKKFKSFNPEHFVLIGFCPLLTEQDDDPPEGDPFIFYSSIKESKLAMGIIQNMEHFERWRMQRRLRKKPRRWVSQGTEDEMTIMVEHFKEEPIDVEIQSVYPIQMPPHVIFDYRLTRDVRDGVIELLPNENIKWENVTKKRITVAVQSAPPKIDREQQTNPTFPSNAWSQYLYEIDDEDLELDETDVDEEEEKRKAQAKAGTYVAPEKPPPEMSSQIQMLLNTLDFNQIDSYRDDYSLISSRQVVQYTNPYLQEFLCFANISKSNKRYVAGYDWYPNLSGLIAVSYAFSTPATINEATNRVDYVQRAVLEPNPVLLWSFSDNLNYKLEFDAQIENTALTFCPFNGDILLGGCRNGQVVLWDLQGRCERLDEEEYLTAAQAKYRTMIGEFLNWTIELEDNRISPATTSMLPTSPKGPITAFYWLGSSIYLNHFGKVFNDPNPKNTHKFFVTCSFGGTISFWNLDGGAGKAAKEKMRSRMLPKQLTQSESSYKLQMIKPTYNLYFPEPITGIIADTASFSCLTPIPKVIQTNPHNYPTKMIAKDPPNLRQSMIVSTFYGHINRIEWQGTYTEGDPTEVINSSIPFARVHDGPVVMVKKNPFYPQLFASIGRTILAIWKEDYNYSPIFWRQRACDLTAVAWSETRPAVLYVTRMDGILEAWDILARDDDACLIEILGGGIITGITEHRPSLPHKILGIGDYNSSIRMVKLPHSFDVPLNNELEKLMEYVLKEERRKMSIQAWEHKYYELNKDIIEAKREAEEETRKEMERIEREEQFANRKKGAKGEEGGEGDQGKGTKGKLGGNYNERMAVLWDELNLNRMMTILMSRKQMDPEKLARETALQKEQLAYEEAKKKSHRDVLASVDNDIATIRSRILPAEVPDLQRSEMIQERVQREIAMSDSYEKVCEDAFEMLGTFQEFKSIDYIEFLERGRQRRQLLDQSLGGNTDRLLWYKEKCESGEINECQFGYEFLHNHSGESTSQHGFPDTMTSETRSSDINVEMETVETGIMGRLGE
ncbi:dynein axonemal intermediate chain 3 [Drosophila kikkawai]|uniref:Dynein axonemal intermediate chain 3 n=1 Tax=Drosophila kikkawai TaxID=30033 RepID=A0A6P4IFS5_DROKI|nr:dynein intermediate chain 3, axonemal [Drosophila kikkawai]